MAAFSVRFKWCISCASFTAGSACTRRRRAAAASVFYFFKTVRDYRHAHTRERLLALSTAQGSCAEGSCWPPPASSWRLPHLRPQSVQSVPYGHPAMSAAAAPAVATAP